VLRDGLTTRPARRRSGLDLMALAATAVSALAFLALWFGAAVLAIAVVVISLLEA
jgi:hypothetical protein